MTNAIQNHSAVFTWKCGKCSLEQKTKTFEATLVCMECDTIHCNNTYVDAMFNLYQERLLYSGMDMNFWRIR